MSVREEILTRVRTAIAPATTLLGTAIAPATKPPQTASAPATELPRTAIPRDYRTTTQDGLDTFLDRLAHYEARAIHANPKPSTKPSNTP